jgi:hypothetical protein
MTVGESSDGTPIDEWHLAAQARMESLSLELERLRRGLEELSKKTRTSNA